MKNEIRNRRSKKDRQHNGQKKKMKRQTTVKKTKDWSTRTLPNKNDNNTENSSPCNAVGSKHSKRNDAEDDPFCYAWLVCSDVLRWPLRLVQL